MIQEELKNNQEENELDFKLQNALRDEEQQYSQNTFNVNQQHKFDNITDMQFLANSSSDEDQENMRVDEIVKTLTQTKKEYIRKIKQNDGIILIKNNTKNNSLQSVLQFFARIKLLRDYFVDSQFDKKW